MVCIPAVSSEGGGGCWSDSGFCREWKFNFSSVGQEGFERSFSGPFPPLARGRARVILAADKGTHRRASPLLALLGVGVAGDDAGKASGEPMSAGWPPRSGLLPRLSLHSVIGKLSRRGLPPPSPSVCRLGHSLRTYSVDGPRRGDNVSRKGGGGSDRCPVPLAGQSGEPHGQEETPLDRDLTRLPASVRRRCSSGRVS